MKLTKYIFYVLITGMLAGALSSCKKYLDVTPDNIATIENAFTMRKEAEKYLFTCYSYLPSHGTIAGNIGMAAGDEWSLIYPYVAGASQPAAFNVAVGLQNSNDPFVSCWDGTGGMKSMFRALRDCNIFLENINRVPDMETSEKNRWIAEVKFLKAYYHFYLVRLYGPIPLIRVNLPIDATTEQTRVYRDPIDTCFNYITQLLDEAKPDLPDLLSNLAAEQGRITQPICLAMKAKVLVYAASPLFNGNADYKGFTDNKNRALFSIQQDDSKWQKAAAACKEAIDMCHEQGMKLYVYTQSVAANYLSPQQYTEMSIRNAICDRWNTEQIWANPNSMVNDLQLNSIPRGLDPQYLDNTSPRGQLAPPLKIVENFYTKNGLPMNEDKTYPYSTRYNLRTAVTEEKTDLEVGYVTAVLNFDREPRFYANLGFDGGKWYGQGKYDEKGTILSVKAKKGQAASQQVQFAYSTTGYWIKKYVHFQDVIGTSSTLTIQQYPWPEFRLADLYLLAAEAMNEANGPTPDALSYINLVRARAGIPSVENAWTNFSTNPSKPTTKEGLRSIIHQERYNELAFEGQRFYDMRRWKEAPAIMNAPLTGWDIQQSTTELYYKTRTIFFQTFSLKDYFWPIRERNITVNRNLVQNPGW
ncbi:RagB/SusD family nutrient uptake outer membrane protein [Chitinophaga sp. sic0106]|uniref:RagB/SusD family nutrient uptake outer membrane protein n=1 Tax=Chitinophaga sp. sic0106 TaxID=2854785 RepID=UPI001C468E50|nr:RagB/SusD family nutrient uptake outer membrane protein [Chitinophaga sp. sic0106]MBV7529716.1 RagB/SusD family nutrient uptake outer membrane protein [Chitinophaga sp. sic0106]